MGRTARELYERMPAEAKAAGEQILAAQAQIVEQAALLLQEHPSTPTNASQTCEAWVDEAIRWAKRMAAILERKKDNHV